MAARLRARSEQAHPIVQDMEAFIGDETLAVPTTAGGTALASVPAGARAVYIYAYDFDVIIRPTSGALGGNPAAKTGITIKKDTGFDFTCDPTFLKLLGSGGTANIYALYRGEP